MSNWSEISSLNAVLNTDNNVFVDMVTKVVEEVWYVLSKVLIRSQQLAVTWSSIYIKLTLILRKTLLNIIDKLSAFERKWILIEAIPHLLRTSEFDSQPRTVLRISWVYSAYWFSLLTTMSKLVLDKFLYGSCNEWAKVYSLFSIKDLHLRYLRRFVGLLSTLWALNNGYL